MDALNLKYLKKKEALLALELSLLAEEFIGN
jgi:hypothetical protein